MSDFPVSKTNFDSGPIFFDLNGIIAPMREFSHQFSRRDALKAFGFIGLGGLGALALDLYKPPQFEGPRLFIDWQQTVGILLPAKFNEAANPNQEYIQAGVRGIGLGNETTTFILNLSAEVTQNSLGGIVLKTEEPTKDELSLHFDLIGNIPFFTNSAEKIIKANIDPRYPMGALSFTGDRKKVEMLFTMEADLPPFNGAVPQSIKAGQMDKNANLYLWPAKIEDNIFQVPFNSRRYPKNVQELTTGPLPDSYCIKVTEAGSVRYYTGIIEKEDATSNA